MIKTILTDGAGAGKSAHIHTPVNGVVLPSGLAVYTEPLVAKTRRTKFFLNPTFGADMNQNVTFGGTPENVHDGGDNAGWTGTAIQGIWDFADTTDPQAGAAHVSITDANNLDMASFADGTETDMSGRTALSGQVQLVSYNDTVNSIILQFQNNGVAVGDPVNLNNFIDTGIVGSYQGFAISKSSFGISGDVVDELDITIVRIAGTKPTVYFDVLQIEETGNPAEFVIEPSEGKIDNIVQVDYTFAGPYTGITTVAGATENATLSNLSFNKILDVTKLPIGINTRAQIGDEVPFSATFTQLIDFVQLPSAVLTSLGGDGTNSFFKVSFDLSNVPQRLDSANSDRLIITINDDLSGLLFFRATAIISEVDIKQPK